MTNQRMKTAGVLVAVSVLGLGAAALGQESKGKSKGKNKASSEQVKRGEYLITTGGCHDCHTPLKMTDKGPEPDMSRAFSGHPEGMKLPPPPKPQGPWGVIGTLTMTAWHGPWGTSYVANISSDKETGIGSWTEKQFVETLQKGRHQGRGRQILPPMPWMWIGKADEADLKAIYAYLQTTKPIKNRVPQPVPPPEGQGAGAK